MDERTVLGQGQDELVLGPGNRLDAPHAGKVGRKCIGNNANLRCSNPGQPVDLSGFAHPHLEYRPLVLSSELKNHLRQADQIVQVARRFETRPVERQY